MFPDNVTVNISTTNESPSANIFLLMGGEYIAYSTVVLIAVLLPVTLLDVLLFIALLGKSSISKIIRAALINTIIACLVLALGLIMHRLSAIILTASGIPEPNKGACGLILFLIRAGGASRLAFMGFYAVMVFVIVTGKPAVLHSFYNYIVLTVIIWCVTLVLCLFFVAIPSVSGIGYQGGMSCNTFSGSASTYIYESVFLSVYGLIPCVLSVTVPLATLCHIKRNTFSEDIPFQKATVRLALFLIIGNAFNLLAYAFPAITAALADSPAYYDMSVTTAYLPYAILTISLLPPPILILLYFRPVRVRIVELLTCKKAHLFGRAFPSVSRERSYSTKSSIANTKITL